MNDDKSPDIYDYAEEKAISIRRILDFTRLTNPLGPSDKAKHAIRKALKGLGNPLDRETRYLRKEIVKRSRIGPDSILFGQGATSLLGLLLAAFKPKKVLVPSPVPRCYAELTARHGGECVPFPLYDGDGSPDSMDLLPPVLHEAGMLIFPNPHRLTGSVIPLGTLEAVERRFRGSERLVVVDEALMEFTGAPSQSGRAMSFGNFAVLRSFSFFHCLAGLPLGYLIADPAIIDRVKQFFDPGPVSAVASAGALASLRDRGFYKRTVEYIKAEKAYFKEKIGKAEGMEIIDRGGSFLVLRLLKELPDLVERLLERRILIDSFEDSEKTLCLRLPIRRHRENARFAKTLLRIVGQRKPLPAPEVC